MADGDSEEFVPLGAMLTGMQRASERIEGELLERERKRVRESPHSAIIEREVIGCIVRDGSAALAACDEAGLVPADFYEERFGWIYDAARTVNERGIAVTVTSIVDQMARAHTLSKAGGPMRVQADLQIAQDRAWDAEDVLASMEESPGETTLATLPSHAALVVEHARRRRVIEVCRRTVARSHLTGADSAATLDLAMRELAAIECGRAAVADNRKLTAELQRSLPAFGGVRETVPTGFHDFDRLLHGGFAPGDLVIVAARPSMGKTQFLLDVCESRCIAHGRPVLFFSLEMAAEQLHTRIAGARARANPMNASATRDQRSALARALADLSESPLRIDETPGLSIGRLRAQARAARRREPIELIVVDYLQLLAADRQIDNKASEVGEISRALKALARELRVPVVALSQLNRGVEARADKRPMMSDLRESGALEQDADVIAFLYREEYYLKDATPGNKQGVAEVIVAKHRNGPTGVAMLHFGRRATDPQDAPPRFGSLARGDDDE